jgi:hypothetical protein
MATAIDCNPWISLRAVARMLDTSTTTAARLAREGRFRSRLLPGMPPQYARADVERIARQAEHAGRGGHEPPGGIVVWAGMHDSGAEDEGRGDVAGATV